MIADFYGSAIVVEKCEIKRAFVSVTPRTNQIWNGRQVGLVVGVSLTRL